MAVHNLCLILKNPLDDSQFLLLKQSPPPKFGDDEYDSYVDSDLWDLPFTQLNLLEGESHPRIAVEGEESYSEKVHLRKFDVDSALNRVLWEFSTSFTMFVWVELYIHCDKVLIFIFGVYRFWDKWVLGQLMRESGSSGSMWRKLSLDRGRLFTRCSLWDRQLRIKIRKVFLVPFVILVSNFNFF